MSCTESSAVGPPRPKKRKTQPKKLLTDDEIANLLAEISDESPTDVSSDSDEECGLHRSDHYSSDSEEDELTYQHPAKGGNIIWENDPGTMEQFHFRKSERLLEPPTSDKPIDYFRHIFTESILDEIITQTNDYARNVLCRRQTTLRIPWKEITKDEMLVFVGLILHMGNIRMNSIDDYWKTDTLFGLNVFPCNMSRNRFVLLLRALHFGEIPEQYAEPPGDQLYKIRSLVNMFNTRMTEIYYPEREICIHESVISRNGWPIYKKHVSNKCDKRNVKLCMVTTSKGMVIKLSVCSGDFDGEGKKVVLNLLKGLLDVGHSVFMNNCYNSYELAKCLADRKTHCTGTITQNRKTFPKEVGEKRLKKGETIGKYANGVMIGKWKYKRDITYISNEYHNDMVESRNKRGEIIAKPLPVIQYNKFISGIDKHDQMFMYYPFERQTIRWPARVFAHVLQIIISNSHHLYNEYSTNNVSLYEFRLSVIRCLLKSEPGIHAPVCESEHVLKPREDRKGGKILRKQCKSCYAQGKRKDTTYICRACDGSPGYCLDCARITHK